MGPNAIADRYFEVVRARDIEGLVLLYASDAVLLLPNGSRVTGIDAIRAFQSDVYARGAPYPMPGSRVVGENSVAVEIEAKLPDGSVRRTANFLQINPAGQIQRLSVYAQGQ